MIKIINFYLYISNYSILFFNLEYPYRLLGYFWTYFISEIHTGIYKFKRLFKNEKAKKWDLHFDSPSGKSVSISQKSPTYPFKS